MKHLLAVLIVSAMLPTADCQSSAPKPVFEVADVHSSPRDTWVKKVARPDEARNFQRRPL